MIKEFILQSYRTLADHNVSSLEGIFTYPQTIYVHFYDWMLASLFTIVLFATYFSQKRLEGEGNFVSSFAVAGWLTAMIATIMALIPNMINFLTISVCYVVAFIGTAFLLIRKE